MPDSFHCMKNHLIFPASSLWQILKDNRSLCHLSPARSQSSSSMQEVAWTIKEVGFISKQRRACTSTHLLEHAHFSSFLFWACWSWEPWQPNTEGRKICAAWPSSIPLAVMLKLSNPMTKTTFHISVIVFKEFLLNRGISQRAYLIVLKPSGVTCECEFFCSSAQPDTHFFVFVHTCGSLHCLWMPAVDICVCVWVRVSDGCVKIFASEIILPQSSRVLSPFYENILAARPQMSNLQPETWM